MTTYDSLNLIELELKELIKSFNNYNLNNLNLIDSILIKLDLIRINLVENDNKLTIRTKFILEDLINLIKDDKDNNKLLKNWNTSLNKLTKSIDKKFPSITPLNSLFPPKNSSNSPTTIIESTTFDPSRLYYSDSNLNPLVIPPQSTSTPSSSPSTIPSTTPSSKSNKLLPFSSEKSIKALNQIIALHLVRLNLISPFETFLKESSSSSTTSSTTSTLESSDTEMNTEIDEKDSDSISPSTTVLNQLSLLHEILADLEVGNCTKALGWLYTLKNSSTPIQSSNTKEVDKNRDLEFLLRKEEFIRLLLSTSTLPSAASNDNQDGEDDEEELKEELEVIRRATLLYGGIHFRNLMNSDRSELIGALFNSVLYLPLSKLQSSSPYSHIYGPYSLSPSPSPSTTSISTPSSKLIQTFTSEYLNSIQLPQLSPLSQVTQIGSTIGLSRILKVTKMMKDKKTEWSTTDELPVEIPLPPSQKFHSIFICPVSKEQATEENFPVLLNCGHVVVRESLLRLAKGTQTVKCPYCPTAGRVSSSIRLYF